MAKKGDLLIYEKAPIISLLKGFYGLRSIIAVSAVIAVRTAVVGTAASA